MSISTNYMGPKVIFADGENNLKEVHQLLDDFQKVGIYAGLDSTLSVGRPYDLILSLRDKESFGIADICISTISMNNQHLLYRTETSKQRISDFILIRKALDEWQQKQPLWACVLIGGKSSRMGSPKHLIMGASHKSWLEEKVDVLSPFVEGVVFSGAGEIPASLSEYVRVYDINGLVGPMAGIASIMQRYPQRSWIVCACDMPLVSETAVQWLIKQRRFAQKALIPMRDGAKKGRLGVFPEPLFACYESSCRENIEVLTQKGILRVSKIIEQRGVLCPVIPQEIQNAWANINTPEEVNKVKDYRLK